MRAARPSKHRARCGVSQRLTGALPTIQWPSFRSMAGKLGNEILVVGIHQSKRPGFDPGPLLFAHRKGVVAMKQLRLSVVTIDHRFVLAVAFGVASLTSIVLLLKKEQHNRRVHHNRRLTTAFILPLRSRDLPFWKPLLGVVTVKCEPDVLIFRPKKMPTDSEDYLGFYPEAEIVLAVCCPLGTDYRPILDTLKNYLSQFRYEFDEIKLSSLFAELLEKLGLPAMESTDKAGEEMARKIQAGNLIRKKTRKADILALVAAGAIAAQRPEDRGMERERNAIKHLPVPRTAHVIVSLKRPEEVETLRRIYGAGFFLIGISSTEDDRIKYLRDERGLEEPEVRELIETDAKEEDEWGQRTRDTFFLSDVFLRDKEHKNELRRFLDLVFGSPDETPTIDERSMYAAYSASFSSGDLSRQVGAAVIDNSGDLISVGWNDVPKFGGGLYSCEDKPERDKDHGEDSNDRAKSEIANSIATALGNEWNSEERKAHLLQALRAGGFFDITEFQRAVHAEMEAILSCARNGRSTRSCTLYVTTFPCHNCTKHIIAAGFKKVFYIEPYAKSKALSLHEDAITLIFTQKDKIPFLSFIGIGPRRYLDLFSLTLGTGYKIERKSNGKKIAWKRATAVPRLQMQPVSYLDREELALHSLNKLVSPQQNLTLHEEKQQHDNSKVMGTSE